MTSTMTSTTTMEPSLLDPLGLITPNRPLRSLTRKQMAFLITQGHLLTIHRQFIYRLNSWLGTHPGGDLPVLHFVGRDATDEIEAVSLNAQTFLMYVCLLLHYTVSSLVRSQKDETLRGS